MRRGRLAVRALPLGTRPNLSSSSPLASSLPSRPIQPIISTSASPSASFRPSTAIPSTYRGMLFPIQSAGISTSSSRPSMSGLCGSEGSGSMIGRSGVRAVPMRAGAETEFSWKQYAPGDPKLFDNWRGHAPGALPEDIETDPNDDKSMAPDQDPLVPGPVAVRHLLIAFGVLFVFYEFVVNFLPPEQEEIDRDDWRTLPPSTYYDWGGDPSKLPPKNYYKALHDPNYERY